MTATDQTDDIYSEAYRNAQKAQAVALKEHAAEAGLSFDGYFVPCVASWALAEIEAGRFISPSEILFVAMQTYVELMNHPDLRQELFRREIRRSLDDPRESVPADEVFDRLLARIKAKARQKPAQWPGFTPPLTFAQRQRCRR